MPRSIEMLARCSGIPLDGSDGSSSWDLRFVVQGILPPRSKPSAVQPPGWYQLVRVSDPAPARRSRSARCWSVRRSDRGDAPSGIRCRRQARLGRGVSGDSDHVRSGDVRDRDQRRILRLLSYRRPRPSPRSDRHSAPKRRVEDASELVALALGAAHRCRRARRNDRPTIGEAVVPAVGRGTPGANGSGRLPDSPVARTSDGPVGHPPREIGCHKAWVPSVTMVCEGRAWWVRTGEAPKQPLATVPARAQAKRC